MNILKLRRQHVAEKEQVEKELKHYERLTANMIARLLRLEAEVEPYKVHRRPR